MALIAITEAPRIISGGGPITGDVYKSHATNLWTRGALLKLASGLLTPFVDTSGGAAEIDTDDTGTSNVRMFLALEDHLTAGTVFVSVQEILIGTVLEIQLLASGSTAPTTANISVGATYTGYQLTGASRTINGTTYNIHGYGVWGLDVDDTTTPILTVIDVDTNYNPHDPGSDDNYAHAKVKIKPSVLS